MRINYIQLYRMADVTVGAKLELDAAESGRTLKQIKTDIKEATAYLIQMQEQFGESSKEAINAAKRVNELKDKIKDANEVADLFDPGKKFQAVTNAVNGLVGGFTALTGAMGLLGVESEEVQKQLLKVQSALALSQGLSTIADSAKDFKRLGDVIVNTLGKNGLIGVAIAGVTALGLAISGVFTKRQRAEVEAYNDTMKDYAKAAANARQEVVGVSVAFENARKGLISKDEALKNYNDTLGESLGKTNDFATAEKNLADKAETYIKITGLKAQANALFAKSAEQAANALIAQEELAQSGLEGQGGIGGRLGRGLRENINKALNDAKEIENIGANLLRQSAELSKQFNINQPAPTAASRATGSTPKVTQAKTEDDELRGIALARFEREQMLREKERAEIEATKNRRIEANNTLQVSEKTLADAIVESNKIKIQSSLQAAEAAEHERKLRVDAALNIGTALGALSEIVGKQTAAGKVLGIAQATINTFIGATEVLRAKSTLPEPFGTIAKIANVATVIATGLSAVKNIVKTPVPGYGGGASGGQQVSAPLQTRLNTTNTLLNQQQLNQIGNATVRAFVVESDMTNNQERIRRLNRAARL